MDKEEVIFRMKDLHSVARRWMIEKDDELHWHQIHYFVPEKNGWGITIMQPAESKEDRDYKRAEANKILRKWKPTVVIHIGRGYTAPLEYVKIPEGQEFFLPWEHPMRTEMLFAHGAMRNWRYSLVQNFTYIDGKFSFDENIIEYEGSNWMKDTAILDGLNL